jgi:hypothetical protein
MERGDVYLIPIDLPNRAPSGGVGSLTSRNKLVVVLRGGGPTITEDDVPIVVASTDRRKPGQGLRTFEVAVGIGEGFSHDTIIDCRWPFTLEKSRLPQSNFKFRLSGAVMQSVSIALVSGLQMMAPPAHGGI